MWLELLFATFAASASYCLYVLFFNDGDMTYWKVGYQKHTETAYRKEDQDIAERVDQPVCWDGLTDTEWNKHIKHKANVVLKALNTYPTTKITQVIDLAALIMKSDENFQDKKTAVYYALHFYYHKKALDDPVRLAESILDTQDDDLNQILAKLA